MQLGFRRKTVLGIAAVQLALLGALILLGVTNLRGAIEQQLYRRAETSVELLAAAALGPLTSLDWASLQNLVDQVQAKNGMVYAHILDRRDKLVAAAGKGPERFKPDRDLDDVREDTFNVAKDIAIRSEVFGRVHIGLDVKELRERVRHLGYWTASVALLEMLFVGLLSYSLASYLLRGLKELERGAQQIALGKVGHEVAITGSDELATTARAFNHMSRRLAESSAAQQAAEDELRRANEVLEQRMAERTEQLAHQALHDNLTKLPNRMLLTDRLQQAISTARRSRQQTALLLLDLDRFKEINDTLGHQYGDFVLQQTAGRLRNALRENDTVARLGGDEFAIVLASITGADAAALVVQKIVNIVEQPMHIADQALEVGASIGCTIFPDHAEDPALLMKYADMAMYDAKRRRGQWSMYRPDMDQHNTERLKLVNELRRAIQSGQLMLHYQPKVELATGRMVGVEALLRWNHPERGLLLPAAFLPVAGETGLVKPLTSWVIRAAARQMQLWQGAGLYFNTAINIAAENLHDVEFPARVAAILEEYSIADHSRLEMDVSEVAIMSNQLESLAAIKKLSEMRIKVAIGNFGTGYSSLAYIQKLDIAHIKIDRSFVSRIADGDVTQLVKSIIDVGHNLGLSVVAEGVESQEIWEKLRQLGCDSAQGYCLSHALPSNQLVDWMRQYEGGRHAMG